MNPNTEWARFVKEGGLALPVCLACSTVQYPLREVCVSCLSDELSWQQVDSMGQVLASTSAHYSLDEAFRGRLPVCTSSVKLDCGPVVIAFSDSQLPVGKRVSIVNRKTGLQQVSLFAVPAS